MLDAVGRTLKVRNSSPAETGVRQRIELGNGEEACIKSSLQCIAAVHRKGKRENENMEEQESGSGV